MVRINSEVSKRQFVDALIAKVAPGELEDMLKQYNLTVEDTKPRIKASNVAKGYLNSVRKNIHGTKVAIHKMIDLGKTEDIPDEIWYEIERDLSVLAPNKYRSASEATPYEVRVSHGGRPRKVIEPEQPEQPVAEAKPRRGGRPVGSKNKPKETVEAKAEVVSGQKSSTRKADSKGYPPFSEWQKKQKEASAPVSA